MLSRMTSILYAVMIVALIVKPIAVRAETITVPVFLDYQQLQLLMMWDKFKGPNNTAPYLLDDDGCTSITFSEPRLSAEGELLRVDAKTLTTIGVPTIGACKVISRWTGRTAVTGKPALVSDQPFSVEFRVQAARLYDQQGKLLTDSIVLQAVKEQLHLLLSDYRLDLKPETDQLKALLPYFLPHYSADLLTGMIDSLRIDHLVLWSNGLDVQLGIDVETVAKAGPEPTLSEHEMQQLEQWYQSWDAFLTFVIKEAATATGSKELRATLLEILLDARYQFKSILGEPQQSATDPVKRLFIRSWERLIPVMREISVNLPEQNLLPFLSFITAADALKALDRLGPAVGLDISTDGLRRLARLLNDDPSIDPLKYLDEIDPVLQQLFDLGMPGKITQQKKSHGFNLQLIRPVYAASPRDRLNRWVPTAADLKAYLFEIRNLLLEEADARIRGSSIAQKYAHIYRKLMLTTAWQESCWRQYIVHNRKVVPLISASGDIGMLQINEKVWRGFYSPSKLRWDITYNARAGSEILFKFMVNYALKQQEHKHGGNLSNLARATYSAYNGGPSQVSRYRKNDVPAAHKKIDSAFWEKYQQVNQGQELAVAQCFGGQASSSNTATLQINKGRKQSGSKQVTTSKDSKRIKNVEWIRGRNPQHFTIQLAAMSGELAIKEFIKQQSQAGSFAYYRKTQKGRDFYVAIYGSYANRADAEKATAHFASLKPWIRDFGSIQKIIPK
ncbi:MAG: transglycosylase SLT domain-containing protein [Actinobacteria bacterium]|nr:transglycosylase SLT domain-containing protein [Actinomycetota bacterium]